MMVIGELEEVRSCVNRNLWAVWRLVKGKVKVSSIILAPCGG